MPLITEEAQAWADREYPDAQFAVGRNDIERYAYAIGEHDPVHHDPGAARAAGFEDIVAPALFPYVIRMHTAHLVPREELAPDGSATADVPPVETTRAMAGEISIEMGVPVVAGDVVTVKKRIADMYEKEGRSGPLVFVTMEFEFVNQRGELVARERFTRIYR
jgi:hydroxyacyl-ACP dehydratase HTD2-like protein with hotdog domain